MSQHMRFGTYHITITNFRPLLKMQYLRIEIHILNLHWMMKNISYFNVCEARRASRKH